MPELDSIGKSEDGVARGRVLARGEAELRGYAAPSRSLGPSFNEFRRSHQRSLTQWLLYVTQTRFEQLQNLPGCEIAQLGLLGIQVFVVAWLPTHIDE